MYLQRIFSIFWCNAGVFKGDANKAVLKNSTNEAGADYAVQPKEVQAVHSWKMLAIFYKY